MPPTTRGGWSKWNSLHIPVAGPLPTKNLGDGNIKATVTYGTNRANAYLIAEERPEPAFYPDSG